MPVHNSQGILLLLAIFIAISSQQTCDFTSPFKATASPVESPDLPGYIAADYTLPAGSLIIPMDNAKQNFNPSGVAGTVL